MCESCERATDGRRTRRGRHTTRDGSSGTSSSEEQTGDTSDTSGGSDDARSDSDSEASDEDDEGAGAEHHSMKKSFMSKVLSPLIGYGSTFELVQHVYDVNLWSGSGAKKNLRCNVPLRLLMKGHSFSPMYWKQVHNALIDLVRQVGPPKLFWTMSPHEYLLPSHEWLSDELQKALRARLHLPAAEALNMTHVLPEITHGLLSGVNCQNTRNRGWKKHLLRAKNDSGEPVKLIVFTRVEFQDGTHKEGTKRYEGSCRPPCTRLDLRRGDRAPQA